MATQRRDSTHSHRLLGAKRNESDCLAEVVVVAVAVAAVAVVAQVGKSRALRKTCLEQPRRKRRQKQWRGAFACCSDAFSYFGVRFYASLHSHSIKEKLVKHNVRGNHRLRECE